MNKTQAEHVIKLLRDAGFEKTYFSGGCVRDKLLGIEPKDWDVATEATPDEVSLVAAAHGLKFLETGKAYGVTFVIVDGVTVDVATFRKDVGSRDGRRPVTVEFTKSPEEDAQRRDLSINGLFMDLDGNVLDYVSGQVDIKHKVIRAIGNPADRLKEDYLRILRAVRFAAKYDFVIEHSLQEAIKEHKDGLKLISRERIRDEVLQIIRYLKLERTTTAVLWLNYLVSLALLTEEEVPWDRRAIDYAIDRKYSTEEILCLYVEHLHDQQQDLFDLLKLSNEQKQLCTDALNYQDFFILWHDCSRAKKFHILRQKHWRSALRLFAADFRMSETPKIVQDFYEQNKNEILAADLITGEVLIQMGFKPGQQFSIIIERARQLQDSGIFAAQTIKDIIKTCYGDLNVTRKV